MQTNIRASTDLFGQVEYHFVHLSCHEFSTIVIRADKLGQALGKFKHAWSSFNFHWFLAFG